MPLLVVPCNQPCHSFPESLIVNSERKKTSNQDLTVTDQALEEPPQNRPDDHDKLRSLIKEVVAAELGDRLRVSLKTSSQGLSG